MFTNPFNWIAEKIRGAVIKGFTAGLHDIGAIDEHPIDPNQALLNLRSQLALPEPQKEEEATAGRKKTKA